MHKFAGAAPLNLQLDDNRVKQHNLMAWMNLLRGQ